MFYSFKDSYDYTYSYDLREKLFLYESESCNRIDYPFIRMITLNMIVNYDHKRIREFLICAILCLEQLCGGFVTGFTRVGVQRRYFTLLKFGVSLRICSEKP